MFSTYTEAATSQHRSALAADAQRARMARRARAPQSDASKPRPVRSARPVRASRFPRPALHRISIAH